MNIRKLLIAALILISSGIAETHFLNFDNCLAIAMEQSYDMKVLKEDLIEAEMDLKATTHGLRTKITLDMTVPNYIETMQKFEDSLGVYYTPIKQSIYTSGLTLTQPLPTDGNIYLESGYYSTSDYYRDKNSLQLTTKIRFEQPLEALYSYNQQQASLKNARLNYEKTQKQLKREKLDMKYNVSYYFYNLVSAREQEKIAKMTLDYQKAANELAQNKYKAGVIAEVAALGMEIDLAEAENDFALAQSNSRTQGDLLKQLLGIDLSDSLILDYDLSYKKVYVDEQDAVERALKNRLEIREREISLELAKMTLKKTKVDGQITGSVSGYYNFIGVEENDIDVAYIDVIDGAVDDMSNRKGNRGISLDISIPVWDWGVNKARRESARAAIRKAEYAISNEKVSTQQEIRETVASLKSALRGLEILEKSVVVAEKSFDITQKRFANGDIDSQELADNRNRLNGAYTSRLNAFITYKLELADLSRKTFYDYEAGEDVSD